MTEPFYDITDEHEDDWWGDLDEEMDLPRYCGGFFGALLMAAVIAIVSIVAVTWPWS